MGPYYDQANIDRFSHVRDARLMEDELHLPPHLRPLRRDRITSPAALLVLGIIATALFKGEARESEGPVDLAAADYSSRP